jgi:hypothetical protein
MRPFVPRDSKHNTGQDVASAKTADFHGLIPGVPDLPYIQATFLMTEGDKGATCEAFATYWDPNSEERILLATGASLQCLSFTPQIYPVKLGVIGVNYERPEHALVETVASVLYSTGATSNIPWEQVSNGIRQLWMAKAIAGWEAFEEWNKRRGKSS